MHEFMTTEFWYYVANRLLRIGIIMAGALVLLRILGPFMERLLASLSPRKKLYMDEKRARTLQGLLKSILQYTVYFITIVLVLQEFNIDTTSIIAGAGIIGLAVGVGAQNLVRDIISGFFIILEDQYSVGDYVVLGDMSGFVEEIGFRVTSLRDANGVLHIIPNGAVSKVTNYTRGNMQAVINIPVPYEADVNQMLSLLEQVCDEVAVMPQAVERPKVVGIVDFRSTEMWVRIVAKTMPLEQVKVETAIRQKIKEYFDNARIPLPAPATGKRKEGGKETE